MADITVTITIDRKGADVLADLRKRLAEPAEALHMAGSELEKGVYPAFEEGDAKWAELAPWTQRERAEFGYGAAHPILVRTGDYRASFEATVEDDAVYLASDDPRFPTLNNGGVTETGQSVPARPLEDVYPMENIDLAIEAYIAEIFKD